MGTWYNAPGCARERRNVQPIRRVLPVERCAARGREEKRMDWKIELVAIPVTDVDRAKRFYTEQAGFNADHDHHVSEGLRFVQLTPPGSACSIVIGEGITEAA